MAKTKKIKKQVEVQDLQKEIRQLRTELKALTDSLPDPESVLIKWITQRVLEAPLDVEPSENGTKPATADNQKFGVIVDRIFQDLENRSGFAGIITGIDQVGRARIQQAWLAIIKGELLPPKEEPQEDL